MPNAQTVVLDSSNLDAIIADATGQKPEPPKAEELKVEAKVEEKAEPVEEEEDEDGLTPTDKKELSARMLKAIGKKHRMMKEAEEFAAAQYNEKRMAEAKAAQFEARLREIEAASKPKEEPKQDEAPKREAFADDKSYWEAVIDWRAEQKIKAREAEEARKRQEEERQKTIEAAKARVEAARAIVPDWDDKIAALGESDRVPDHIAAYMQEADLLPELAYHFASNPDVLKKLQAMSPHKGLVEIGRIESTLKPFAAREASAKSALPSEPAKEVAPSNADKASSMTASEPSQPKPRAIEPITPINTGGAAQVTKKPEEMSTREMIEEFQRTQRVNFNRRQRH